MNNKINYIEQRLSNLVDFNDVFQTLPDSSLNNVFNTTSQAKMQKLIKLKATADDPSIQSVIALDDLTKTKLEFLSSQAKQLNNISPLKLFETSDDRHKKLAKYFFNALPPNKKRRFTIYPVDLGDFVPVTLHINPNKVAVAREKRYIMHDTINGVVFQDFGYKPRSITLNGTTGSLFYEGIEKLNYIYLNKTARIVRVTFGGLESDILNNKGDFEFKAIWTHFDFNAASTGDWFGIDYTLKFTELKESTDLSTLFDTIEEVINTVNLAKEIAQRTISISPVTAAVDYVYNLNEDIYAYHDYKSSVNVINTVPTNIQSYDLSTNIKSDIRTYVSDVKDYYSLPLDDADIDTSIDNLSTSMESIFVNLSPTNFSTLNTYINSDAVYSNIKSEHDTRIDNYTNYYTYTPVNSLNDLSAEVSTHLVSAVNKDYKDIVLENYETQNYYKHLKERYLDLYNDYYAYLINNSNGAITKRSDITETHLIQVYNNLVNQTINEYSTSGQYNASNSIITYPRSAYIKKQIINLMSDLDDMSSTELVNLTQPVSATVLTDLINFIEKYFKKTIELIQLNVVIHNHNSTEQYNLRSKLRDNSVLGSNTDEFVFMLMWYYIVNRYNNNEILLNYTFNSKNELKISNRTFKY